MIAVAVPCLVFFGFLIQTGGLDQVAGALGEHLTRDELARAARHGHAWGSVHNIELGGMDIDHLVLTPGFILAVETKWHLRGASDRVLHFDVVQARQSAEAAQSILRSKGIDYPHIVMPVVVVWGRGRLDIADAGSVVDGVRVLRGEELASRLADLPPGRIPQNEAEPLVARLEAFAKEHRHVSRKHDQKRSIVSQPVRPSDVRRWPWRRRLA
jgi:Nuclease-related domain